MSDSEKGSASSTYAQIRPNAAVSPGGSAASSTVASSATASPVDVASATLSPPVVLSSSIAAPTNNRDSSTNFNSSHSPVHHHHPHVYPSMYKDTTYTKIFVGGLPYHTSDKTLKDYFEVFGDIEEAVVITDRQTAKSRGYGFVTMLDRSAAERACKEPNPIIDGRKANVNLAYLGAKPRTNGIAALHARAAAASYAPFLQSPLGYPSPYLYPSPVLISPNLFLPNTHSSSANSVQNQNSQSLSPSTTSPPPANGAQSYYDFFMAAALAAATPSSGLQQHQYAPISAQYANFADPTALYNFGPYVAAAAQAGLIPNGSYHNGLMHLNQQAGSTQGASTTSSTNGYALGSANHHMVATQALRGEK